jgi:uncharacterized RDD family membrane protein YckC
MPVEPAGYFTRRRGVAWVVDALLVIGVCAGGASLVLDESSVWDWLDTTRGYELMLLVGFLYLGLVGPRSLGKLLAGLRVTRSDGSPAGRLRLLARALLDMATVGAFLFAAHRFVPYEGEPTASPLFAAVVTPCFFVAWFVRDRLLDLQLATGRAASPASRIARR